MIYYRLLWLAAFLVGVASFLVLVADQSLACGLGAVACTIVCVITYKDTWRKE